MLLRKFNINDAEVIFSAWTSDERVAKHTSWYAHKSIDNTRAYVEYMAGKTKNSDYNWVIESDNKVIGSINVCYSDEHLEIAGIAYVLAHDYWGKGCMTEAARAVIKFYSMMLIIEKL